MVVLVAAGVVQLEPQLADLELTLDQLVGAVQL